MFSVFLVYLMFTLEVSSRIYINYRANPPNVVCSELLGSYSEQEILYLAGLEYLFIKYDATSLGNLQEKIS